MTAGLLAVRLVSELALIAAAVWAGWRASPVVGILGGVAVVVVWWLLVAPEAPRRLSDPARLVLEVLLFLAVGVELVAAGHPVVGVVLGVAGIGAAVAVRVTRTPA